MRRSRFAAIVAGACCFAVALASAATADAPADAPDTAFFRSGETYLRPVATLEAAAFSESNAYQGQSRAVIGDHVGYWYEYAITGGLEGALSLGDSGLLFARTTAIGAGSQGLDAAGSDFDDRYPERLEVEDAQIGWRSGTLLGALGENALEISVGKQPYQIPTGFFMWDGASDGGERGAYWIAPRKAFYSSAVVRLVSGPYAAQLFYLKPNDAPFTSTDVVGGNFEYTASEAGLVGVTYLKIVDSQERSRDGMDFFDWRAALTPLPSDRSFSLSGELALELNGSRSDSYAWFAEAGYSFDETAWSPSVSYRYSWFAGDDANSEDLELWDPLWYGSTDWSTWYVGEIIGAFVALNRDLAMQTVRLSAEPDDAISVQLIYNRYRLVDPVTELAARDLNPRAANIHSRHIGQGVDLVTDWAANEHLSFTGIVAAFDPGAGMQQYVEAKSGSWWLHFMLYTKLSF